MQLTLVGAAGKMGRMIASLALVDPTITLVSALEDPASPHIGADLGLLCGHGSPSVKIGTLAEAARMAQGGQKGHVVVDFSTPTVTAHVAAICEESGLGLVVGTTGLSEPALLALQKAARKIPVVRSANMSLGVNLLLSLLQQVAKALPDADAEIVEIHHRMKKDAPSGTALMMTEAIATGRGWDPKEVRRSGRDGNVGQRPKGEIGVMALRGGSVVGDHTACFFADGERIEIRHQAESREVFARGALRAARFVAGLPAGAAGLYDMQDVLGLRRPV